jgi:hypothetical protein
MIMNEKNRRLNKTNKLTRQTDELLPDERQYSQSPQKTH